VCPPDRNSDTRGQVFFDAAAALIRPPPPLPGRHPTRVAAPLHDFDDHLDLSYLDIKLHVVLTDFYFSHSIRAITTLQLWGVLVRRILPSIYSPVSPSVVLPL
jgi:hypothetical protein